MPERSRVRVALALCLSLAGLLLPNTPPPAARAAQAAPFRLFLPMLPRAALIAYQSDRSSGYAITALSPTGAAPAPLTSPTSNDTAPALSPDGSRIAFASTRDGHNAAYLMARDGSGQRKLADCFEACVGMAWSPDGARLLLAIRSLVMEAIGPPLNRVDTYLLDPSGPGGLGPRVGMHGLWSPDGSRLAVLDDGAGGSTLFVVAPDGVGRTPLAAGTIYFGSLAWSPDGSRLAYQAYEVGGDSVYVVGLDGAPPRSLGPGQNPAWSPDGALIAFTSWPPSSIGSPLVLVRPDGGDRTTIAERASYNSRPAFSPDGALIAFVENTDLTRVAIVPTSGGAPVRIGTSVDGGTQPVWSPDGSRLAFSDYNQYSGPGSRIYVAGRDGGGLTVAGAGRSPAWTPDGGAIIAAAYTAAPGEIYLAEWGDPEGRLLAQGDLPALGPGSRQIAFVRDGELYRVGVDGQGLRRLTSGLKITQPASWSPEGGRLAIRAERAGAIGLYLLDAEGGALTLLAACGTSPCSTPRWSPDGTGMAFSHSGGVYVADGEGSGARRLADGAEPAWSPDSRQIVYTDAGGVRLIGADGAGGRLLRACVNYDECQGSRWSPDGRQIALLKTTFTGKGYGSRVEVIAAADGALVLSAEGRAPEWLARTGALAHLREERFGLEQLGHYTLSASYSKLCLRPSPAGPCTVFPPGHGSVLSYALSP